jgi:WD40 repeat protein
VTDGSLTVFISYAAADEQWAVWAAWQLQEAGYQPRLQAWHSVAGRNFVGWIRRELAAAVYVIVILSPAYLVSDWCEAELNSALADAVSGRTLLIPVRVAPCESPELLREIGRISLVDRPEAEARRVLLAGLRAAADGQGTPTTPPPYPGSGHGDDRPPPYPGPDRDDLTLRLLSFVEAACRAHHPEGVVQVAGEGTAFPYLAVVADRDGERQRWPVGVCVDPPDTAAITAFHESVICLVYMPVDEWVDSELVHLGEPPPEDVCRAARRRRIRIRSLAEFEGRWDPRRYLARQSQRLAVDAAYPPELYVPQRFILLGGGGPPDVQRDVFAAMCDWLDAEDARFLLVLGDFGRGKTFLLRELARRMPREVPQVAPLLIELRALEKTHSVDDLLALHLSKTGEHGVDVRAVRRMVEQGKVALLFDGFDELALRVTYDRAAEHLKTVLSAVAGRAKVVLTSRTQHFITDEQYRTALGEEVRLRASSREIHLADFDVDQVREVLVRLFYRQIAAQRGATGTALGDTDLRAAAEQQADGRLRLIRSIRDLLGLAANPRMLSFIAELGEDELLAARSEDGAISSADLYGKLVARWLGYEAARRQPTRGSSQSLDAGELRDAVDALAVKIWESATEETDLSGLSETVRAALTDLGPAKVDADQAAFIVGSGSLLVRTNDGTFSFVHSSVMEYLVAMQATRQLHTDWPEPMLLAQREMSDLMVDFLRGSVNRDALERWARTVLAKSDAEIDARANALRIARKLDLRIDSARLAGQDLRRQDLNGRNLRMANLANANLSGLRLYDADLAGADLTGADLTGALLVRPVLTGVRLEGSRWNGAALLNPILDPGAEDGPELAAAAIPGRDAIDVMLLPAAAVISGMACSPDGVLAVAWGRHAALLDTAGVRPLRILTGHTGPVRTVAFSPDGTTLATGGDDRTIRLWETTGGRQTAVLTGHTDTIGALAYSPDGTTLATGSDDRTIRLWKTGNGRHTATLTGHAGWVLAVAFSPDGTTLATGSDDRTIRLWETANYRVLHVLAGHTDAVRAVTFSPDGTTLATGGTDRTIRFWETTGGRQTATLTGHTDAVRAVAFSPDGTTLATGGDDRTIRLWETTADHRMLRVLAGHAGWVLALAFSPDGTTLATGSDDRTIRLWETTGGRQTATLTGHIDTVGTLAFSPDGTTLATGSDDRTIRLWETDTGSPIATLLPTQKDAWAAISPDGSYKSSGGDLRSAVWWAVRLRRFEIGEFNGV